VEAVVSSNVVTLRVGVQGTGWISSPERVVPATKRSPQWTDLLPLEEPDDELPDASEEAPEDEKLAPASRVAQLAEI
jgi:hypothetical protein